MAVKVVFDAYEESSSSRREGVFDADSIYADPEFGGEVFRVEKTGNLVAYVPRRNVLSIEIVADEK